MPSIPPFSDDQLTGVGNTDVGACMTTAADGQYAHAENNGAPADTGSVFTGFAFLDPGSLIPFNANINSVQFSIVLRGTGLNLRYSGVGNGLTALVPTSLGPYDWQMGFNPEPVVPIDVVTFTTFSSAVLTTRADIAASEVVFVPWTRDAIVTNPITGHPAWGILATFPVSSYFDIDRAFLTIDLATTAIWCFNPTSAHYVYAIECPGPPFISNVPAPTITITSVSPRST